MHAPIKAVYSFPELKPEVMEWTLMLAAQHQRHTSNTANTDFDRRMEVFRPSPSHIAVACLGSVPDGC